MGKIRIKTLGDEEKEREQKKRDEERREGRKIAKLKGLPAEQADMPAVRHGKDGGRIVQMEGSAEEKPSKAPLKKISRKRGRRYLEVRAFVDKTKTYSLAEAVSLVKKTSITSFDATVEVHINTSQKDIRGSVTLPHGTGKQIRIAIADDKLLGQVENGQIGFDLIISHPDFMPKLARVAKILGPKGLMPNPKNGTVSENPEEAAKKFTGSLQFKTESSFPIIHSVIGKTSFPDEKLAENFSSLIKAVGADKIKSVYLKSTMSPGVRVEI